MSIAIQNNINPEVSAPLDARATGTSLVTGYDGRPTGIYLYDGLLRYETDTKKFMVYDAQKITNEVATPGWVDAGLKMGSLDTGGTLTSYMRKMGLSYGGTNNNILIGDEFSGIVRAPQIKVLNGSQADRAYEDDDVVAKKGVEELIQAMKTEIVGTGIDANLDTLTKIQNELKQTEGNNPAATILDNLGNVDSRISTIEANVGNLGSTGILANYIDESDNNQPKQHEETDYVQLANGLGRIAYGTTVQEIQSKYTKLSHLISAMLDVAPVPQTFPQIQGAGISLSGQSSTLLTFGAEHTRTWTVSFNRGIWRDGVAYASDQPSGSPTNPNLYVYGPLTTVSIFNPFNNQDSLTTGGTGDGQIMTAVFSNITYIPSNMTSVTMGSITAQSAPTQHPDVYDNKGNRVAGSHPSIGIENWSISNPVTYDIQAPVYVGPDLTSKLLNGSGATNNNPSIGQSNTAATQYLTNTMSEVIVPSHVHSDFVRMHRQASEVRQWNQNALKWPPVALILDEEYEWVPTPVETVGNHGAQLQFYNFKWKAPKRGNGDLKFTFT